MTIRTLLAAGAAVSALCSAAASQDPPPAGEKKAQARSTAVLRLNGVVPVRPAQGVQGKQGKGKAAPAKKGPEKKGPEKKGQVKAKAIKAMPMRALGYFGAAKPLTQEELRKRRDDKLADAWIKNAAWIPDYDKAREVAKAKNQKVFAYFTRSYAP